MVQVQNGCGIQNGCISGQLIDTVIISVPRIFEKYCLQHEISVQKLNKQENDKKDVGTSFDSGAEVAEEEDGSDYSLPEHTGYVPSKGRKHAEH